MKLKDKFATEVARIKEPEIFLGVARILGIKFQKDETSDFWVLLDLMLDSFEKQSKRRRKELVQILGDANRAKIELKEVELSDSSADSSLESSSLVTAHEASEVGI